MVEAVSMAAAAIGLALAARSTLPLTPFNHSTTTKFNFGTHAQVWRVGAEAISEPQPGLPSLCGRRLDWWSGSAQWRGPGEETDSARMAVKGERDPAARAHIQPTSSRKPVAGATLVMGGAEKGVHHHQQCCNKNSRCVVLKSIFLHEHDLKTSSDFDTWAKSETLYLWVVKVSLCK